MLSLSMVEVLRARHCPDDASYLDSYIIVRIVRKDTASQSYAIILNGNSVLQPRTTIS